MTNAVCSTVAVAAEYASIVRSPSHRTIISPRARRDAVSVSTAVVPSGLSDPSTDGALSSVVMMSHA